jgi:hypothetical protein
LEGAEEWDVDAVQAAMKLLDALPQKELNVAVLSAMHGRDKKSVR